MKTRSRVVAAPSSKSVSHRKVIAACLAAGQSRLARVLESDDLTITMTIMRDLGAVIERTAPGEYAVTGIGGAPRAAAGSALSCWLKESGTSCRLLTAVLAAGTGQFRLHGVPRLHVRPMRDLILALETLGTTFSYEEQEYHLPLTMAAHGLAQPENVPWLPVSADVSSQYLSGVLLAAPLARDGLSIVLAGTKTVSWPYVSLTFQTLEDSGCVFRVESLQDGEWKAVDWRTVREARPGSERFRVDGGGYHPLTGDKGVVEGDYSGASYLLAAGAVGTQPVTVSGLNPLSMQGDRAIVDILANMGAGVAWRDGEVTVTPGRLRGVDLDMGRCPDLVPTVAVLAAMAQGETVIRGVPHLREKECDRLQAPSEELAKVGCRVEVTVDGLIVRPAPIRQGRTEFSAYNDHRMAMSLALLETAGVEVVLDDPGCVAKSFPDFWDRWRTVCPGPGGS